MSSFWAIALIKHISQTQCLRTPQLFDISQKYKSFYNAITLMFQIIIASRPKLNALYKQRIETETDSSKTHNLVLNSIIGLKKIYN